MGCCRFPIVCAPSVMRARRRRSVLRLRRKWELLEMRCRAFVKWARRGGRYPGWAPAVAVGAARRLRCDAQRTRAAAMPLASGARAPLLHGFSPVRPWRAGLPLALLRFSPRHKSPTPDTAHRAETLVVCIGEYLGASGRAVVG